MSRVLVALLALAAVLAVVLWRVAASGGTRSAVMPVAAESIAPPRANPAELTPALATAPAPERVDSPPSPSPLSTREEGGSSERAAELARARWVEGRVVFPEGTPLDEELHVTADGRDFGDGSDHRVRVERDGAFRLAFSEKSRSGRIELAARYLYLPEVVRWKEDAPEPIVLEPALGGRIVVSVVAPGDPGLVQADDEVVLQIERRLGDSSWNDRRSQALTAERKVVFDALRPENQHHLRYDGKALYGLQRAVDVQPGTTSSVQLALRPGIVLAGRVLDESGAPIAEAEVRCNAGSARLPDGHRVDRTRADGGFRVGALAPGNLTLEAQRDGFESHVLALGRLEEGTTRADLELVLRRGASIAGTVTWPDGTPAEADIELSPRHDPWDWDGALRDQSGKSDASGRFRITGLAAESYLVRASVTKTDEATVTSELTGRERKKKSRTKWSVELDGVKPGTQDLVLTLSTGLALTGRVLDERGVPLPDFRVSAGRRFEPGRMPTFEGQKSQTFRDAAGGFTLSGFTPGDWGVVASAEGHARSETVNVTIAAGEVPEPIEIRLPREARVSGVVLDDRGAPCADALVTAERSGGSLDFVFFDVTLEPDSRTGKDGTFRLGRLRPGPTSLTASGPGGAPSEPHALEIVAGEDTSGIVLRLRAGAVLVCEVVGSDGRPEAGVDVDVFGEDSDYGEAFVTADDGRFEARGLPPGTFHLAATNRDGLDLMQSLVVREGETAQVRLAPPRGALVRLHGHLRAGTRPLGGASVSAYRSDDEESSEEPNVSASSSAKSDAQGAYELLLPGPGRYELTLHTGGMTSLNWGTRLDVPEVAALVYDVEIPLGRVSGRVTDAEGAPLAGVWIESQPGRHEESAAGGARTRTDEEGRYELELPAGMHALSAGGDRGWWGPDGGSHHVAERARDLVVNPNGHLRGIDFVLSTGGVLEGRVRTPDGASAAYALIWSDTAREPLGWSDDDGTFRLRAVAPGTHWIRATHESGATRVQERVEIEAGKSARLELELAPATLLHVRVRDAAGARVGCEIEAVDGEGAWQPMDSGETGEAWIGPLVAGRYTVRARRDGKLVEKTVEVAGAERELPLELAFE